MKQEPYIHHIETIFQAIDIGLDQVTELPGNSFKEVKNDPPPLPESIDPDRFNRMLVVIDGERYCISVFRPRVEPPHVLDLKRPHKWLGPEGDGGQAWAWQDGKIYGWSESNIQYELVWWLDDHGFPVEGSPNPQHIANLCADRPFNPSWLEGIDEA